jgi:alpha-tubulin suppressor-like RCC1 family protein
VSVGTYYFAWGLTTSGAAYCWGQNADGELGNGSTINSLTPVAVSGGLTFATVTAGGNQTCGVTTSGAAYCWGHNANGQLGNGTFTDSTTPVAVAP